MIYLKYMPHRSAVNASRNKRELSVAIEYGYETAVFSNDSLKEGLGIDDKTVLFNDGTIIINRSIPKIKRIFLIIRNKFKVFAKTRKLPCGVWSCHDLSSLKIAWLSNFFRRKKSKLIYDSHEFELGRNAKRSKFKIWLIKKWEKFLMKRCAFSIMVNDSIADEVQRIHKLKDRPIVLRSTPNKFNIDIEECKKVRCGFESEFKNNGFVGTPFILMNHGVIMGQRGIETLIKVVQKNPNVCGVILGNGDERYIASLQKLADELNVRERIIFHPAVQITELWKYVGAVDIGFIMPEAKAKSYYYSLPNKFFENIQSLTPIIASRFPEIKRIIEKYEIGLMSEPTDIEEINKCVERMRTEKEFYARCKENLKLAKEELCWENEKKVLIDAFINIKQMHN